MTLEKINRLYQNFPFSEDINIDPWEIVNKNYQDFSVLPKEQKIHDYKVKEFDKKLSAELKKKLYENGIKTHNCGGLEIPLNPNWKKILVNLSGGADSAITTYILASIIKKNNFDITIDVLSMHRCWFTRPWQKDIALKVFNWLRNQFPTIIGEFIPGYIMPEIEHGVIGNLINNRSGDQISVASANYYYGFHNRYYAIYNATTKNPSTDYEIEDRMKNRDLKDDDYDISKLAFLSDNKPFWNIRPLRLVEKDWVIQQYINNDIIDLFETTRSCEGDCDHQNLIGMDFNWYMSNRDANIPECGDCFWCIERNWAKKKVGLNG